jgi:hypothetical protein
MLHCHFNKPVRTYLLLMSVPPQKGLLLPGEVRLACQGTEPVSAVQFSPAGQMIRPGEVATRPHSQALYNIGLTFKSLSQEIRNYLYDYDPSEDFKSLLDVKKENQDMKLYLENLLILLCINQCITSHNH